MIIRDAVEADLPAIVEIFNGAILSRIWVPARFGDLDGFGLGGS